MEQQDRVAITLAMAKKVKAYLKEIDDNNVMGDKATRMIMACYEDMDITIQEIENYQHELETYVNSSQAAEDFREGELLKQAGFREDR